MSAVFCVICSLFMFVSDASGDRMTQAPNDTSYKRWSCHSGHKLLCKFCRTFLPTALGVARFTVFGQSGHANPLDGCRCSSQKRVMSKLIQVRQLNKRVWICDICYKQIHVRKQISIRSNRIGCISCPALTTTTPHPFPTPAWPLTSHSLSRHTCNTNNSARITVTATTSST